MCTSYIENHKSTLPAKKLEVAALFPHKNGSSLAAIGSDGDVRALEVAHWWGAGIEVALAREGHWRRRRRRHWWIGGASTSAAVCRQLRGIVGVAIVHWEAIGWRVSGMLASQLVVAHWQSCIVGVVVAHYRALAPSDACGASVLALARHLQRHVGGKSLEQGLGGEAVAGQCICGVSMAIPWHSGGLVARWQGIGGVGVGALLGHQSELGHWWLWCWRWQHNTDGMAACTSRRLLAVVQCRCPIGIIGEGGW